MGSWQSDETSALDVKTDSARTEEGSFLSSLAVQDGDVRTSLDDPEILEWLLVVASWVSHKSGKLSESLSLFTKSTKNSHIFAHALIMIQARTWGNHMKNRVKQTKLIIWFQQRNASIRFVLCCKMREDCRALCFDATRKDALSAFWRSVDSFQVWSSGYKIISRFLSWCFALWNYLILLYCELKVYGTIIIVHWLLSFTGFRCLISRLDLFLIKLRSKSLPSESAMMLEHTFSINSLNWSKWLQCTCNIINTPLNSDEYLRIVSIASNAPLSSQAWKLLGYAILAFTFAV